MPRFSNNLRTVVSSVIFSTSFPSDDLHFTQYRVWGVDLE